MFKLNDRKFQRHRKNKFFVLQLHQQLFRSFASNNSPIYKKSDKKSIDNCIFQIKQIHPNKHFPHNCTEDICYFEDEQKKKPKQNAILYFVFLIDYVTRYLLSSAKCLFVIV